MNPDRRESHYHRCLLIHSKLDCGLNQSIRWRILTVHGACGRILTFIYTNQFLCFLKKRCTTKTIDLIKINQQRWLQLIEKLKRFPIPLPCKSYLFGLRSDWRLNELDQLALNASRHREYRCKSLRWSILMVSDEKVQWRTNPFHWDHNYELIQRWIQFDQKRNDQNRLIAP